MSAKTKEKATAEAVVETPTTAALIASDPSPAAPEPSNKDKIRVLIGPKFDELTDDQKGELYRLISADIQQDIAALNQRAAQLSKIIGVVEPAVASTPRKSKVTPVKAKPGRKGKIEEAILEALSDHEVKEIAAIVKACKGAGKETSIKQKLGKLAKDGKIKRVGSSKSGEYKLA